MRSGILLFLASLAAVIHQSLGFAVALRKLQCDSGFYKYPSCADTPAGYWCECGTGFEWNSNICMTESVDSRLDFKRDLSSYAIILGKNMPLFEAFTVAAWVKIQQNVTNKEPTLIAYSVGMESQFHVNIGNNFILGVANKRPQIEKNWGLEVGKWIHVAVTWDRGGSWNLYKNGIRKAGNSKLPVASHLKEGGELTIGHMTHHLSNQSRAFLGELSHVHLWDMVLNETYLQKIATDCTFTYCGNVAEWVDFRSGTRGTVKLRWPSRVFDECVVNKGESCDSHCSETNGPQCNQEYAKNILWPRTPTGHNSTRPCPGISSGEAIRMCMQEENLGIWMETNFSTCVSSDLRELKNEIESNISDLNILVYLERLYNSTSSKKTNPSDLSTSISCLRMIVDAQARALSDYQWTDTMLKFNKNRPIPAYPRIEETNKFVRWVTDTVANIIDQRNDVAWNATLPRGAQAVQLLSVMDKFVNLFARSFLRHIKRGDIKEYEGQMAIVRQNIAIYVETVRPSEFAGSFFPDIATLSMSSMNPEIGRALIPDTLFDDLDTDLQENRLALFYVRYEKIARYLPNHPEQVIVKYYRDKEKEHRHKEDNVNSVVMTTGVFAETDVQDAFANLSDPVEVNYKFIDSFNISNPECVFIDISGGSNDWHWRTSETTNISSEGEFATCLYYRLGTFAVTTDMYNINWDPGEPPRFVMTAAGYIGILILITMLIISLSVFFYLRCTTDTVAVHRNLAVSLIVLHVLFMIGITRQENATVCKIFAIAIHFFFTASFCWICNEAFNLYIEVANSIHADTQQQRPMLRYYVIGWFVPAVLVFALVQSKWETYFSPDVCFINFDHIWLFAGPAGGFWAITVFVLVYTGKDIMESSYSKDKEANKVISNHCKGCWIQVVLMAIAWAFAIISVDLYSIIPQILFAMFAILQGAFFFVFFCTLDGEITEILAERRSSMGFNVSPHGLQRSTKYSVYRRYLPPRTSSRRQQAPSHIHSPSSHGSNPYPSSDRPREMLELQSQPRERGGSWQGGSGGDTNVGVGGGGGDRSPSLARWGSTAVQALRRQQHLARKDSDAKREVLSRFFRDDEVRGALDPPSPIPESENVHGDEEDRLVTSV